jgi:hypothetical protein
MPLLMVFNNSSGRTINRIDFDLSARYPNFSTNLVGISSSTEFDRIIKPGEKLFICVPLPQLKQPVADPLKLEWSLKYKHYIFAD